MFIFHLDWPGEDEMTTSGLPDNWVDADASYNLTLIVEKIKPAGDVYWIIDDVTQQETTTDAELNGDDKTYNLSGSLYLVKFNKSQTTSFVRYRVELENGDELSGDYRDVEIRCKL